MIKNVIFDCGKVLVQYDETYIASFFTDNAEDAELLGRVGMARKYWDRFDRGDLEEEEYLKLVKEELPLRLHESVERLSEGWIDHCDSIPGMAEAVSLWRPSKYPAEELAKGSLAFMRKMAEKYA